MFKQCLLASAIVASSVAVAAAATITQTAEYEYLSGPWAGEVLSVEYSYASLPVGELLPGYQPEVTASAEFLGATATGLTDYLAIFSGNLDIFNPEIYLSFDFDFQDTALGLTDVEIFASQTVGVFYLGAPELQFATCGADLACTFSYTTSFSVRGVDYDVSTIVGTFDDNADLLKSQVWWGDTDLSVEFASAVELFFGAPNDVGFGPEGPWFANDVQDLGMSDLVYAGFYNTFLGLAEEDTLLSYFEGTYAIATRLTPVPLPAGGLFLLSGLIGMAGWHRLGTL